MTRTLVSCAALAVVQATAASARSEEMQPPPEANAPPGQQPRAVRKDQAVVVEHKATEPTTTVFWVDTSIGWQRVDLTTLHVQRNSAGEALTGDLVPNVLSGPALSLGVGVRWLVLSFGARMTAAFFNDPSPDRTDGSSQFYSLDAEIGLRIPAGRLEPYVVLGAGYSVFGGLDDAIRGVGQGLDIDGANARLALGVDYFFSRNWSLGARVTGELLFLARPGVPIRGLATAEQVNTLGEARARLLEGEGTSGGTALAFTFGPGLHF